MSFSPLSLRRRSMIAFTFLGFVLSLGFSLATDWMADKYESTLALEFLQSQAEDYSAQLVVDPATPLPRTRRLKAYLQRGLTLGDIPAAYAGLQPGYYEMPDKDGSSDVHVGVFDTKAGRLYFVIDLSAIERFEKLLDWAIVAVLVLGTSLSGWLGWLLADNVLRPVRTLAKAVDTLPIQPHASALANTVSADGLGRLASAIDRYQARLVAADARERAFYADASHELRTPIAVVLGAAEVVLDDPNVEPGMQRRLRRMQRGARELNDLLDVLLGMARRRTPHVEAVDARELLGEAISALGSGHGSIGIEIEAPPGLQLHLPRHESLLLLRIAIRRVVPPESAGKLQIRLHEGVIDLDFAAADGRPSAAATGNVLRSDDGQSPRLAGHLAEQLGWRLERLPGSADGMRLRLPEDASLPS